MESGCAGMLQGSTKQMVEHAWDETSVRLNPFKHDPTSLEVQESMKWDIAAYETIV